MIHNTKHISTNSEDSPDGDPTWIISPLKASFPVGLGVTMKVCTECKKEKSHDEFRVRTRGGLESKCKICRREQQMEYYRNNKDKYRKSGRKYQSKRYATDPEHRQRKKERMSKMAKKWKENNPEKLKAHWALKQEIRTSRMKRESCVVCANVDSHGHHEDYSKPLDVIWLCRSHHAQRHAGTLRLPSSEPSK